MKKEQYEILLAALADKLKEQQTTISLQGYEIERLRRKLAEAEGMETPATAKEQKFGFEIR